MARQSNPNRWMKHLATPAYIQDVVNQITSRTGLRFTHLGRVYEPCTFTYRSTMLIFEVPQACGVVYAILNEGKHYTAGHVMSNWELGLSAKLSSSLLPRRTYIKSHYGTDEPDYIYDDYAPRLFRGEYWRDLPHFMPTPGRSIGSGMEFRLANSCAAEMRLSATLTEDLRIRHKAPINVAYAIIALLDKVHCYIAPAPSSESLTEWLDIKFWPPTCGHDEYLDKQRELWKDCPEEVWQRLSKLSPNEIAKFRDKMR